MRLWTAGVPPPLDLGAGWVGKGSMVVVNRVVLVDGYRLLLARESADASSSKRMHLFLRRYPHTHTQTKRQLF